MSERCDSLGCILGFNSLAGGTGSGLGSRLWTELRDQFPEVSLVGCVVWPHRTGEVPVQNFNATLSLAHSLDSCDALWCAHNDSLHEAASLLCQGHEQGSSSSASSRPSRPPRPSPSPASTSKAVSATKSPHLWHLNSVLARQLCASTLLPCWLDPRTSDGALQTCAGVDFAHLLCAELCCSPQHKLLSSYIFPTAAADHHREFESQPWHGLARQATQACLLGRGTFSPEERAIKWWLSFRGVDRPCWTGNSQSALLLRQRLQLLSSKGTCQWMSSVQEPSSDGVLVSYAPGPCSGLERTVSAVGASSSIVPTLDDILHHATETLTSGAYLHHYTKWGMEKEELCEALVQVEHVLQEYSSLLLE